jgi:hypothetical protein
MTASARAPTIPAACGQSAYAPATGRSSRSRRIHRRPISSAMPKPASGVARERRRRSIITRWRPKRQTRWSRPPPANPMPTCHRLSPTRLATLASPANAAAVRQGNRHPAEHARQRQGCHRPSHQQEGRHRLRQKAPLPTGPTIRRTTRSASSAQLPALAGNLDRPQASSRPRLPAAADQLINRLPIDCLA